jgi:fatty acid desaturase
MQKHNIGHHTYTNSDVHDTDIRDYDEIFTNNGGKSPFFHKHKVILFWCVTSVLYFNLIILSYRYIIKERKYNELVLNLLSLLLLPTALIMNFWWIGVLIFLGMYVVVWVHLAFAFMVNHIGMPIIDGATIRQYAWLDLQTLTSRNVSGWSVVHHIFWGLNKQIEHHLFPQIARNKIQKVSLEVRDFCKEKGIPYHDVSFWHWLKEIYRTLKTGETVRFDRPA